MKVINLNPSSSRYVTGGGQSPYIYAKHTILTIFRSSAACILSFWVVCFLPGIISCTDHEITTGTLLEEMTYRDKLAQYPDPYYTCRQFSSYDRQSVSPHEPGWFANWDRSQFLREEIRNGRRELVMFDADGPGAIVRFWVTVARYKGNGTLRIYIDGNDQPVIEGEVLKLIGGGGLTGAPLSVSVSELTEYLKRGHNLYLPIPYARHCKVTYESDDVVVNGKREGERFYYNINYRTWEKNVRVRSFTINDTTVYAAAIQKAQQQLAGYNRTPAVSPATVEERSAKLAPQGEIRVDLKGPQAIRELQLKLDAADLSQALRSTVLVCRFDGQQTIWCPVGDFFGSGYQLASYKSWYTEVSDNRLSAWWVMPFEQSCQVVLKNYGKDTVNIENLRITAGAWKWNNQSMYFGAGWFEQHHLDTGSDTRDYEGIVDMFDVNFVTLTGKGVLAGTGVVLFNTVDDWWGEGDEKIYVDGETFPSHFGTGTEDYYGYAWCMHNEFHHPFIAQPIGRGAVQPGYVSNLRYRALDAIPFTGSLKFDMEMWHSKYAIINHAPVSYWYMLPGGKSSLGEESEQVQKPVAMTAEDIL